MHKVIDPNDQNAEIMMFCTIFFFTETHFADSLITGFAGQTIKAPINIRTSSAIPVAPKVLHTYV